MTTTGSISRRLAILKLAALTAVMGMKSGLWGTKTPSTSGSLRAVFIRSKRGWLSKLFGHTSNHTGFYIGTSLFPNQLTVRNGEVLRVAYTIFEDGITEVDASVHPDPDANFPDMGKIA